MKQISRRALWDFSVEDFGKAKGVLRGLSEIGETDGFKAFADLQQEIRREDLRNPFCFPHDYVFPANLIHVH